MKEIHIKSGNIEKLWNEKLSGYVKGKINSYKLVSSPISDQDQNEIYIKIINTLLDPFLVYSGPHRLKQWEKGWGQNLIELDKKKDLKAVSPKYFSKYPINRLAQKFVKGISKDYEKNMLYVILDYVFDKYFRKRKYLNGYLNFLRILECKKKIKVLETKLTYIGSMYIEGYSVIAWKPL